MSIMIPDIIIQIGENLQLVDLGNFSATCQLVQKLCHRRLGELRELQKFDKFITNGSAWKLKRAPTTWSRMGKPYVVSRLGPDFFIFINLRKITSIMDDFFCIRVDHDTTIYQVVCKDISFMFDVIGCNNMIPLDDIGIQETLDALCAHAATINQITSITTCNSDSDPETKLKIYRALKNIIPDLP